VPADPLPDRLLRRRLEVGARLRDARLEANLTQERLGERAGLDHKTVSRIETGTMSPLLDTVLDLADAIGVSAAQLMPGGPPGTHRG
jgi:transcriptional regulator with XRE-family HTH domain